MTRTRLLLPSLGSDAIEGVRHAVTGFTETIDDMIIDGDKW